MPSSDSEDFESADEGQNNVEKKERKKRLSSSNYSDNALEADIRPETVPKTLLTDKPAEKIKESSDGWDDFDIDVPIEKTNVNKTTTIDNMHSQSADRTKTVVKETPKSQDTGWDDFGDWGDEKDISAKAPSVQQSGQTQTEANIREVTDRLAASTTSGGWGWGWGVDSLLSSATAGITTLTSQVSQGISTVLESGIGAPDPEELAKQTKANESKMKSSEEIAPRSESVKQEDVPKGSSEAAFPFGNIFSGVSKFVETTGSKVITGGLDTLETIGKKTMEVLQDGDPGLVKKRAMFGLDQGDKPVLSQVLREAKAKSDEEDRLREEKREAKEVHYENLFDDFEGLVHLEALEMLSRQVSMRIEERIRSADPEKKQDIKETLQQVTELCEMPEEEEEDDELSDGTSRSEAFHERLQTATQDLGVKIQFQNMVKQYTEILEWLSNTETDFTEKVIYKKAVSSLAQSTALAVEIYHKTAEMLLVKARRSTADEADALTQMTVVLTKHIGELATLFTEKLNSISKENKDQSNTYITNIFLEAGNSSTYIQNAFQLALPILQIGAV